MSVLSEHLKELRGEQSQREMAEPLGIKWNAWARYERGEVSPGAEILRQICIAHACSADWLLGLPERGASATTITGNTGSIAIGQGAKANCTLSAPDCTRCKYKVFAEAFKAIQTPS